MPSPGGSLRIPLLLLMLACASVAAVLYESRMLPPVQASMGVMIAIFLIGFFRARQTPYWLLPRLGLIVLGLPFLHLLESNEPILIDGHEFIWGLLANPYQQEADILALTALLGVLGMAGMVAGFLSHPPPTPSRQSSSAPTHLPPIRPLTLEGSCVIAGLAIVLSWSSAPMETLASAAYTASESPLQSATINFNAGWLLSHILTLILVLDHLADLPGRRRRIKAAILIATLAVIVGWFQFLRGDREAVGLLIAIGALYLLRRPRLKTMDLAILGISAMLLFLAVQAIGSLRSQTVSDWRPAAVAIPLTHGTWTASLMTVLSVAGDDHFGLFECRCGDTYVDFARSATPGIMAQVLDYERPLEGTRGPAWEMRYGLGGTHAVVVPFMNFRVAGVILVLFAYGWLLARAESAAYRALTVPRGLFYGTLVAVVPFWFWYGEMNLVRGLMACLLAWLLYLILPKAGSLTDHPHERPVAA